MKLLFLLFVFLSSKAFAFVISKTEVGKNVKWSGSTSVIDLYINPIPKSTDITLDVDENSLSTSKQDYIAQKTYSILLNSINEWNQYSDIKINPIYSTSLPNVSNSRNTFRYTDEFSYFGSGIIAVTSIAYNAKEGDILSADILVNQSGTNPVDFTLDPTISSKDNAYIGDVFTHEVGHFFGLSHSEVIHSSMKYSIFKNQYDIHPDDIAGLRHNYGKIVENGRIYGRVIAGNDIPIFGVNVQLLSANSGEVVQAQVTDSNGEYNFKNLEEGDSYYILVSPLKNLQTVSDYYKNVNKKLCFQEEFQPTFYMQCGSRHKSRPQLFELSSSEYEIDAGDLTIRCDENLDANYFAKKIATVDREYELIQDTSSGGVVFNGYFSTQEVSDGLTGLGDDFILDLSHVETSDYPLSSYSVKLNLLGTTIGSNFDFYVSVKRDDEISYSSYQSGTDSVSGKKLTNLTINLKLSSDSSDNVFSIKVYPLELTTAEQFEIFSAPEFLSNLNNIYILSAIVGLTNNGNFTPLDVVSSYPYEDNKYCVEGSVTKVSVPYVQNSVVSSDALRSNDDGGFTCGTVDLDGSNSGGGPLSFSLALLLAIFIILPGLNSHYSFTKY